MYIWPMVSSPYSTYSNIRRISPTKNWGVKQVNLQSPQLSQRDDFVCSDILQEPTHHKTTHGSRILQAAINHPPADWWHRAGRPRRTWLHTIEVDLQPHNLGLNTAWMRAQDCSKWHQLVETAMLTDGCATRWWWWYMYMSFFLHVCPWSVIFAVITVTYLWLMREKLK